jgi:hypothetical protein
MKKILAEIDWFKQRGFSLGRDLRHDVYYVVSGKTGERFDFGSIEAARQFVIGFNIHQPVASK